MRTKRKIVKALSVVFIVFIVMSVAVTSVSAADNSRSNAIDARHYRMTFTYSLANPSSDTLQRWNTYWYSDDRTYTIPNRQYEFYCKTFKPSSNDWNNRSGTLINNINSLKDDNTFNTYRTKLDNVYQEYSSALEAGNLYLLHNVKYETIEENNSNIESCTTNLDTAKTKFQTLIDEVEAAKRQSNAVDSVNSTTGDLFNIPQALWSLLGSSISDAASNASVFGLSLSTIETATNNLSPYITVLAYLVLIVSFSTSASESAMRFELTTVRGAMRVFVQVALGKVGIDLSVMLCVAIVKLINSVAAGAILVSANMGSFSGTDLTDIITGTTNHLLNIASGNPLAIFSFLFSIFPKIVICIVIITTLCKVMIKLVMRNFELGCLIAIAPLGFATLAGESTKRFFMKYLGALLGTAMTILFIAITYNLVSVWLHNIIANNTSVLFVSGEWLVMIILCGASSFIWKPPAALTHLFTFM